MAFNHYSIGKARHKPHEFYEYEPHLIGALLENWAECVFPLAAGAGSVSRVYAAALPSFSVLLCPALVSRLYRMNLGN